AAFTRTSNPWPAKTSATRGSPKNAVFSEPTTPVTAVSGAPATGAAACVASEPDLVTDQAAAPAATTPAPASTNRPRRPVAGARPRFTEAVPPEPVVSFSAGAAALSAPIAVSLSG